MSLPLEVALGIKLALDRARQDLDAGDFYSESEEKKIRRAMEWLERERAQTRRTRGRGK